MPIYSRLIAALFFVLEWSSKYGSTKPTGGGEIEKLTFVELSAAASTGASASIASNAIFFIRSLLYLF